MSIPLNPGRMPVDTPEEPVHERWCAGDPCDCVGYCPACGSCGYDGCCGPQGEGYKAVCRRIPGCLYPEANTHMAV